MQKDLAAQLEAAYQHHQQVLHLDTPTLPEGKPRVLFCKIAKKMEGVETQDAAHIAVLVHNAIHSKDILRTVSSTEYAEFIAWIKTFLEVLCGDTELAASAFVQFNRLQGEDTLQL